LPTESRRFPQACGFAHPTASHQALFRSRFRSFGQAKQMQRARAPQALPEGATFGDSGLRGHVISKGDGPRIAENGTPGRLARFVPASPLVAV